MNKLKGNEDGQFKTDAIKAGADYHSDESLKVKTVARMDKKRAETGFAKELIGVSEEIKKNGTIYVDKIKPELKPYQSVIEKIKKSVLNGKNIDQNTE